MTPTVPNPAAKGTAATTADHEASARAVPNRPRHTQGQPAGVITTAGEGRDCRDAVTQLAAVSRALDRAGFKIIAGRMRECLTATEDGGTPAMNEAELEKLFLTPA